MKDKKQAIHDRVEQIDFVRYSQHYVISQRLISAVVETVQRLAEQGGDTLPSGSSEDLEDGCKSAIATQVQNAWQRFDEVPSDLIKQITLDWPQFGLSYHAAWDGELVYVDSERF